MAALSISKAWDESKAIATRDGRLIGAVSLALVLLPQTIFGVIAPPPGLSGEQPPSWVGALSALVLLAGVIAQVAIVRLALGPATSVGESIAHGAKRALPAVGALMLFVLPLAILCAALLLAVGGPTVLETLQAGGKSQPDPAVGGVLLLFVLFVVAISIRFQMVVPVATAETANPIQILRRSWELTRGHYWRLLGFFLLIVLLAMVLVWSAEVIGGILGRLVFGDAKPLSIGALVVALITSAAQMVFTALASVMLARIYAQLSGRGQADVFA